MKAHTIVPRLLMAAGLAVPVAVTIELLSHFGIAGSGPSLSSFPPPSGHNKPPSSGSAATPTALPQSHVTASGTFPGPVVQGFYGPVQASLVVRDGKITKVSISAPKDNPSSAYINSVAVPLLRRETLRAQSAKIDGISGATVTSDAYYQSLQSALKKAHL